MDRILIAGIDTVVGANLAATLSTRYVVSGIAWNDPVEIADCESIAAPHADAESVRQCLMSARPDWIVFCGPAARSLWENPRGIGLNSGAVTEAGTWAAAAKAFGCDLTVITSDGVFTGPWMFHREKGLSFCEETPAKILRMIEEEVERVCPEALIVRTNAIGWAPRTTDESGREMNRNTDGSLSSPMLESWIEQLRNEEELELDCIHHATPILANHLAEILDEARAQKLQGLFHIAGGERISPFRFACLLADQFGLNPASLVALETPLEDRKQYGKGETSLQTRRIRQALEIGLPMARDAVAQLFDQLETGYADRFGASTPLAQEIAA